MPFMRHADEVAHSQISFAVTNIGGASSPANLPLTLILIVSQVIKLFSSEHDSHYASQHVVMSLAYCPREH